MKGIETLKALIDGKTLVNMSGDEYFLDEMLYFKREEHFFESTLSMNDLLKRTYEVRTIETLSFSKALNILKSGRKVSREGWNGKGQYIEMQNPDINSKMTEPYLYIKTVDGGLVPWLASQTDLLADDWYEVE